MPFAIDILQPGDSLLYWTADLADWLIGWHTGEDGQTVKAGHIEKFIGNGQSLASRAGGVNQYELRLAGLVCVRRPVASWNLPKALAAFASVKGAPYGWSDIVLDAGLPPVAQHGMDCSHFASWLDAQAGAPQFDKEYELRRITPRDYLITPASFTVWQAG